MYPHDYTLPFTVNAYDKARVIACCSDEYIDGCADLGLPPPHEKYCLVDCAQQSCFRMVHELDETIKGLEEAGNTPGFVLDQFVEVRNYLLGHIIECQTALFDRLECDVIAEENGVAFEGYCDVPNILRGRYRIPDSDEWNLIKDLYGDLDCEVNGYSRPDVGASSCQGVQGNNDEPFGGAIVVPLQSIEATLVIP